MQHVQKETTDEAGGLWSLQSALIVMYDTPYV